RAPTGRRGGPTFAAWRHRTAATLGHAQMTMMPMAHEVTPRACRTLLVMSARAGLEAQLHAEYRSLVAALGPWRQVFDLRDTPSQIKTRGPAESAIFRSGDVTLYRFGPTIVVQRRLSGWTEAYFLLRETRTGMK